MHKRRTLIIALALCLCMQAPALSQTPTPAGRVEIRSPRPGAVVGGVVSVLGTVELTPLEGYSLAFGAGDEPLQWIPIGPVRQEATLNGRLALWDTTQIPDGLYTLRLRATYRAANYAYLDAIVPGIMVSNAPRTPTRVPTQPPTATPSPTLSPTATQTPMPTLSLSDGVSPYLYVTLLDQYDPLCPNWQQRYSIWLSNVGMITLTHVVLTDVLPLSGRPLLPLSTEGATFDGERQVVWPVGTLLPGQVAKYELQVELPSWLLTGQWVHNEVRVSCDQLPYLGKGERSLLDACPWLEKTATARGASLPALGRTPSATPLPSGTAPLGKPTLRPTATLITFSVPEDAVQRGLDALTVVVSILLGVLVIITIVLIYRRLFMRR